MPNPSNDPAHTAANEINRLIARAVMGPSALSLGSALQARLASCAIAVLLARHKPDKTPKVLD